MYLFQFMCDVYALFCGNSQKTTTTNTIKIETCFAGVSSFGFELLSRLSQVKQLHITKYAKEQKKNKFVSTTFLFSHILYALKSLIQPKFKDEEHAIFAECAH